MRIALLAAVAVLAVPAAASASSATGAQMRALAARASSDPQALTALEQIDVVDGRPVDIRGALQGAEGAELRSRLSALAEGGVADRTRDPSADARSILAGRRFHESSVPRPLHRPLRWLGQRLRGLAHWIGNVLDPVADHVPGGDAALSTVLAVGVLAAVVFVAARVARRRAAAALAESTRARRVGEPDPNALEREAEEAERRGELERALRLRFRAGLIRLARAKAIPPERSLTSGDIRRALGVDAFDDLVQSFDEVVYGRRPPSVDDLEAAREEWKTVLAQVRS